MNIPTLLLCAAFLLINAYEAACEMKHISIDAQLKKMTSMIMALTLAATSVVGIVVGHFIAIPIGKIGAIFGTVLLCAYAIRSLFYNRTESLKKIKGIHTKTTAALASMLVGDEVLPISIGIGILSNGIKFVFPIVIGIALYFIFKTGDSTRVHFRKKWYRIMIAVLLIVDVILEFFISLL